MQDWVTIRHLKHLNEDLSYREIGRLVHVSKNTVKKAVESDEAPQYKRQTIVNPAIKPFEDFIYDAIIVNELRPSRVLRDIISKGYNGSSSAFYRYISKLVPNEKQTFHPYETAPGEQAQFDWSPYTVVINGILTKVYVFSYILGFSRYRIYEASLTQTLGSTFDALENSILETGGTPERIQTDNATCFLTNASRQNREFNVRYLQLCGHYRIEPTRSLVKHPWSKGKVEKPFAFLEDHFIKGNEFDSFEDFCSSLKNFQNEVNNRVHATTKQKPIDLYNKEISSLKPLPKNRFVDIREQVRKVTADCMISYEGSRYSVPYLFATKEVWVKISKGYILQIYSSQNNIIAEHKLSLVKGKTVINEEHYKNHSIERGNWERLKLSFLNLFPEHEWFPEKLKTQKRINPNYHLTQLLELTKYYRNADIENAILACLKFNVYTSKFIEGYLQNHCHIETIEPCPIDKEILASIESIGIKRPLSDYNLALL